QEGNFDDPGSSLGWKPLAGGTPLGAPRRSVLEIRDANARRPNRSKRSNFKCFFIGSLKVEVHDRVRRRARWLSSYAAKRKPGCQRCHLKTVRPLIAWPRAHRAIEAGVNVQAGEPSSHNTLIWVKTSDGALDIVLTFLDVGVYGGICRRREQGPGSFLSVTTGVFLFSLTGGG